MTKTQYGWSLPDGGIHWADDDDDLMVAGKCFRATGEHDEASLLAAVAAAYRDAVLVKRTIGAPVPVEVPWLSWPTFRMITSAAAPKYGSSSPEYPTQCEATNDQARP